MLCIVSKQLVPKGFRGLTIFPFIFIKWEKDRQDQCLINHEMIHIYQQFEMLFLPFFVWYIVEFLIRWAHYKNAGLAYRNISFEREAYTNDRDAGYLSNRRWFAFRKYL